MNPYLYRAKVIYVVEGNVYDVVVDLGFRVHFRERLSLEGLDVPDLKSGNRLDRNLARGAKDCAMGLLLQKDVFLETFRRHSRQVRWSANIYLPIQKTKVVSSVVHLEGVEYISVCKYMRQLCDWNYDVGRIDIACSEGS